MSCIRKKKHSSSPWMTVMCRGSMGPMDSWRSPWGFPSFHPEVSAVLVARKHQGFQHLRWTKDSCHRGNSQSTSFTVNTLGVVGGGCQPHPPPKKNMGEYRFNKKSNNIEMGGSLGLTCAFSGDVLAWRFVVGFLDVCWLLGCVRYSVFKIPLLSKTSPLHPRNQTWKDFFVQTVHGLRVCFLGMLDKS